MGVVRTVESECARRLNYGLHCVPSAREMPVREVLLGRSGRWYLETLYGLDSRQEFWLRGRISNGEVRANGSTYRRRCEP